MPAALAARSARSAWRMVVDSSSAGSSAVTPMLPETSNTRRSATPAPGGDRPEVGDDPLGEGGGLLDPVPDEDGELVAAEPADEVLVPDGGAQPGRDLDQQVVPRLVPGDVVDRLEPVEVQQQQAGRLACGGAAAGGWSARPSAARGWAARSGSRCRPAARARVSVLRRPATSRRCSTSPSRLDRAVRQTRRRRRPHGLELPPRPVAGAQPEHAAAAPPRGRPPPGASACVQLRAGRPRGRGRAARRPSRSRGWRAEDPCPPVATQVTCPRSSSTTVTSAARWTRVRK